MLASLSDGFEILSVFDEDDDPDVCFIGQLAVRRGSRFELAEISTRARWEGVYRSRVGRVSRVDVGGGYEAALRRVAGPRPA